MKTFEDRGNILVRHGVAIPKTTHNSDYRAILASVEKGEAEILPFEEPEKPVEQQILDEETKEGITDRVILNALLEAVVGGDDTAALNLYQRRAQIKQRLVGAKEAVPQL